MQCKCSKCLSTQGGTAVNEKLAAGTLNENQCSVSPKSVHEKVTLKGTFAFQDIKMHFMSGQEQRTILSMLHTMT